MKVSMETSRSFVEPHGRWKNSSVDLRRGLEGRSPTEVSLGTSMELLENTMWTFHGDPPGAPPKPLRSFMALIFFHRFHWVSMKEGFNDWRGEDTTISSPGRSPKQPLPGIGLYGPLLGRQACLEFIAFDQVGQICPR